MNAIKEMLGEGGKVSSMRVLAFVVTLSMLMPPVIYALRNNISSVDIDWQALALVLGAMGMKAAQKFGEGPEELDQSAAKGKS